MHPGDQSIDGSLRDKGCDRCRGNLRCAAERELPRQAERPTGGARIHRGRAGACREKLKTGAVLGTERLDLRD